MLRLFKKCDHNRRTLQLRINNNNLLFELDIIIKIIGYVFVRKESYTTNHDVKKTVYFEVEILYFKYN